MNNMLEVKLTKHDELNKFTNSFIKVLDNKIESIKNVSANIADKNISIYLHNENRTE